MVMEHFANPNLSVVHAKMLVFRVFGVRQNLYVYSLYRNPDLGDQNFYCLLASMAAVQAEDVRASFMFVGDLTGHHQELDNDWPSSGWLDIGFYDHELSWSCGF